MTAPSGTRRARLGVAGLAVGLLASAGPLLATAPAGADTPTTHTVRATTATQSNVAPGTPLTGLHDGDTVTVRVTEHSAADPITGIVKVRQCEGGVDIPDAASLNPGDTGFCLSNPLSAGSDNVLSNIQKAGAADSFIELQFRVGEGEQDVVYDDGTSPPPNHIACDSDHDCSLWLQIARSGGNDFVHFDLQFAGPPVQPNVDGDYDGDGRSDLAVFRPSTGRWYVVGQAASIPFGTNGDIPVPAQWDADASTDIGVFRPSTGRWYVQGRPGSVAFGTAGDIPVPADYDGDGLADLAVFRPSTGRWYVQGQPTVSWGTNGDIPVPGDYDGDGTIDLAVFRPSTGRWYVHGGATTAFGTSGDRPVPADYDGDGSTDLAVFRPSTARWYVLGQGSSTAFGSGTDQPVPAHWDADAAVDLATYRNAGNRLFVQGTAGSVAFGTGGDVVVGAPPALRRLP